MKLTVKHFEALTTRELYAILKARNAVFIVEQSCPYQDIDDKDLFSYHVFYEQQGEIQAYVRVVQKNNDCPMVSIGRVLTISRGSGLGIQIMNEGIRVAKEKLQAKEIHIEAQSHAKAFYEKVGFVQISEEFLLDDIAHIEMVLKV